MQESKAGLILVSGQHCLQGYRPSMEDESILLENFSAGPHGTMSLYGVFDGHGGTMAARFVKDNIERILLQHLKASPDPKDALRKCYLQLDEEFLATENRDSSGTTAVCALVQHSSRRLWVANVGDSRCVLSTKDEAKALSLDHKPERPDEQERIRKAGGFVIHNRVMGGLAVSRAIGDCDFKSEGLLLVIAEPDIEEHRITSEDKYILLACDGLFDVMQNDAVCRFIKREFKKGVSSSEAASAIGSHAIKTLHSQDNVSVVIVRFEHHDSTSNVTPMSLCTASGTAATLSSLTASSSLSSTSSTASTSSMNSSVTSAPSTSTSALSATASLSSASLSSALSLSETTSSTNASPQGSPNSSPTSARPKGSGTGHAIL